MLRDARENHPFWVVVDGAWKFFGCFYYASDTDTFRPGCQQWLYGPPEWPSSYAARLLLVSSSLAAQNTPNGFRSITCKNNRPVQLG